MLRYGETEIRAGDDEIFLDHWSVLSRPPGLQDTDSHLQRQAGDRLCGKNSSVECKVLFLMQ